MPSSSSGKWVARAGATGGGRTYRGQVPTNWYLALVLLVLVGIASVVYSRSEYRSAALADTTPPTKGTTWYAAYSLDICGTQRSPLPSNEISPTVQSFYTTGDGVIVVAPKTTTDAGPHATLGKFTTAYAGLALSATSLTVPRLSVPKSTTTTTAPAATTSTTTTTAPATTTTSGAGTSALVTGRTGIVTAASTKSTKKTKAGTASTTTTAPKATTTTSEPTTTYTNGETCPKGTKDAGKQGQVIVTYWANAFASKEKPSTVTGNPATLAFTNNQEITIGFVPAGTKLPKPTGTVITALLKASTGASASTTPTTTPSTSTTTSVTTTTAPAATTTTAGATTKQ
jgi:hypothetical protein